jgi:hypothetical protein
MVICKLGSFLRAFKKLLFSDAYFYLNGIFLNQLKLRFHDFRFVLMPCKAITCNLSLKTVKVVNI